MLFGMADASRRTLRKAPHPVPGADEGIRPLCLSVCNLLIASDHASYIMRRETTESGVPDSPVWRGDWKGWESEKPRRISPCAWSIGQGLRAFQQSTAGVLGNRAEAGNLARPGVHAAAHIFAQPKVPPSPAPCGKGEDFAGPQDDHRTGSRFGSRVEAVQRYGHRVIGVLRPRSFEFSSRWPCSRTDLAGFVNGNAIAALCFPS